MMRKKHIWIASLVFAFLLGIVLSNVFKTDKVYTHFFYVPIAITAIFYPRYTLIVGVSFACFHLILEYLIREHIELTILIRAVIILVISIVFSRLSDLDKHYKERLDSLSYKSTHDSMTNVFTRGHFDSELQANPVIPFAVFICDIDNLKAINDTFGHQTGDQAIIQTAEILRQSIRNTDTLARFGGDEFGIIAPSCNLEEANRMVDQIINRLKEHNVNGKYDFVLSFSIGFSVCTDTAGQADVLRLADFAMYNSKKSKETR